MQKAVQSGLPFAAQKMKIWRFIMADERTEKQKVSIPIKTSTFFGNSEHSFPEKQSIPFRNRVQFIF